MYILQLNRKDRTVILYFDSKELAITKARALVTASVVDEASALVYSARAFNRFIACAEVVTRN